MQLLTAQQAATLCLSFLCLVWMPGRDIAPFYTTFLLFSLQGVTLTFCELTQSQTKAAHPGTFFSSPHSKHCLASFFFFYHGPPAFVCWTAWAAAGLSQGFLLLSLELFNQWALGVQMRATLSRAELQTEISFLRYSDLPLHSQK